MAHFTSKANGNTSAGGQTTWNEAGVPGAGDTFAYNHVLVIDQNLEIGSSSGNYVSGSVEAAIRRTGSAGRLTRAANVTLIIRGDIIDSWSSSTFVAGAELLIIEQGGVFEFDSSLTTPTTVNYAIGPDGNTRPNCRIKVNGTEGNPVIIRSNAGGGNGRVLATRTFSNCNGFEADNCIIRDCGTDTIDCIQPYLYSALTTGFRLNNVVFERCGRVSGVVTVATNMLISCTDVTFKNSLSTSNTGFNFTSAIGTGTYLFRRCYFDKTWGASSGSRDVTFEKCSFFVTPSMSFTNPWAKFEDCIVRKTGAGDFVINGVVTNLVLVSDHDTTNPHYVAGNAAFACSASGYIVESTGISTSSGDVWLTPTTSPAAETNYICENMITLPNPVNGAPGAITLFASSYNAKAYIRHMTMFCGEMPSMISMGETGSMHPDSIKALENSIFWKFEADDGTTPTLTYDHRHIGSALIKTLTADDTTDFITSAAHNYLDGAPIKLTTTGVLPAPLVINTIYYVRDKTTNTYKVAATFGGAAIDITDAGSGTHSSSDLMENLVHPDNADYNAVYPDERFGDGNDAWFVNNGNHYNGSFSSVPGQHDINTDWTGPDFIDVTRNTETFPSAYLGLTSTAWDTFAGGDTFTTGDFVSNTDSAFYNNTVILYECISTHTKNTANSEPGIGSSWRTYWRFRVWKVVQEANEAKTRITDEELELENAPYSQAIYAWIRRGFTPRNPVLKNSARNGTTDRGAVPVELPSVLSGSITHNRIGFQSGIGI